MPPLKPLEEPYRARAAPAGTARYWSWLFAAPSARDPLLAVYALTAEWRALTDPASEVSAAQIKLTWWHDEMDRLIAGAPLHPITRHIAALPHAAAADFRPLQRAVDATAAHLMGVPLERAAELEAHADALHGMPLLVAAQLADPSSDRVAVHACTADLATAEYLSRALTDYGREARVGRLSFPVDALLAAEIENDDLMAVVPPPRLQHYLDQLRQQAGQYYASGARALTAGDASGLRHLAVLATLGSKHLASRKSPSSADFSLADLYNAWNAARRAAATR
jgi:15-cis-phytoene synthase